MKKLIIAVLLSFISFLSYGQSGANKATSSFSRLSWLEGQWIRINTKPGITGTETWKKVSEQKLEGLGITMKGTDTSEIEKTNIIVKDQDLYYVADVPENNGAVYFKITNVTDDGFVCENPQHDFPKVISYKREGDQLKATISGDGKSMSFMFKKR